MQEQLIEISTHTHNKNTHTKRGTYNQCLNNDMKDSGFKNNSNFIPCIMDHCTKLLADFPSFIWIHCRQESHDIKKKKDLKFAVAIYKNIDPDTNTLLKSRDSYPSIYFKTYF